MKWLALSGIIVACFAVSARADDSPPIASFIKQFNIAPTLLGKHAHIIVYGTKTSVITRILSNDDDHTIMNIIIPLLPGQAQTITLPIDDEVELLRQYTIVIRRVGDDIKFASWQEEFPSP